MGYFVVDVKYFFVHKIADTISFNAYIVNLS